MSQWPKRSFHKVPVCGFLKDMIWSVADFRVRSAVLLFWVLEESHSTHNILEPTTGSQWLQEWPHRVISFFSTGHSRWKEVSSTKLQFKDCENSTWWWILDAVGCCFALLRRVCWPALEECYAPFTLYSRGIWKGSQSFWFLWWVFSMNKIHRLQPFIRGPIHQLSFQKNYSPSKKNGRIFL
jgi:hypothetical protein